MMKTTSPRTPNTPPTAFPLAQKDLGCRESDPGVGVSLGSEDLNVGINIGPKAVTSPTFSFAVVVPKFPTAVTEVDVLLSRGDSVNCMLVCSTGEVLV